MRRIATAWRYGRWALVAMLLPVVIAIQLAIVFVYAWPYDKDELVATYDLLTENTP